MPAHLSLATAIDKNRLSSSVVYVILFEMDVLDPENGAVINTLRCVNDTANFVLNGHTYLTIPFTVSVSTSKDTTPTATVDVFDLGQTFQAQLQAFGRSLDWPARILVVNASGPEGPVLELSYDFDITAANAKDDSYTISLTLGAENPLSLRFPPRQQFRNRCFWKYKGNECQYAGSKTSCDFTLEGANGCRVHDNIHNYGGFRGIKPMY